MQTAPRPDPKARGTFGETDVSGGWGNMSWSFETLTNDCIELGGHTAIDKFIVEADIDGDKRMKLLACMAWTRLVGLM